MRNSMNARVPISSVLPVLLVLAVGVSPTVNAQMTFGSISVQGDAEVGVFPQPVPNTDVAKYREYSDLAQQVIAPEVRFLIGDNHDDRVFADFRSYNLGQVNQMYNLHAGVYGLLDIQVQYLDIPHYLSDDVGAIAFGQNNSNFTLSSHPAPPTPGQAPGKNIGTWVNDEAHPVALDLLDGVSNLHVRYTPDPHWTYTADFNFQNPSGQYHAFGTMFGPSPGTYNIAQVFQPINYDIYNYGVGAEYSGGWWTVGAKYNGSFFKNQDSVLRWSNPDVWNQLSPTGKCTSSTLYSPSGGTGPCAGQMQLYPDNQAHTFTVDGGLTLPFHTRAMGSLSYGWWLQNQGFIPLTVNTALPNQRLPQSSLGGDVQPFFANATLVSNPVERLELRATYSYNDYNNEDPALRFKNIKSLNDVASTYTATAFPFSFSDQNIDLTSSYLITPTLAARFVGRIDTNHNAGLMVLQQDTTSYGPVLDWTPSDWLEFRGSYQYANRDSPGYNNNRTSLLQQNAGNMELSALRRFDEASVHVNQFNLYGSLRPFHASEDPRLNTISIYAAMDYDDNSFPASQIGLQHSSTYIPSVGLHYQPSDDINLFTDYSWQATDWNMASMQRSLHGPIPTQPSCPGSSPTSQNPQNCPQQVWTSYGRDQGSSVTLGMQASLPPISVEGAQLLRNKSKLSIDYTYAFSTDSTHANGDAALGPATVYPNIGTQFHELIVQYEYPFKKNMALDVGYYFNHFGENDFAWDNLRPWMGSASPYSTFVGSTTWTPYTGNAGYLALKYSF
ncbi:MAG TPA: MtrB/PioB family outer membrane beta-barrel protein [Terriglobales bacterium]|nr:MtrB/PioB family outer membrane beta-barrel protein [Terriglobales bacterium]